MSPAQNLIKIQSKKKNNNKSNKKNETNPNRRDWESERADAAAAAPAPLCSELVSVSFDLLMLSSFCCWCVDDLILLGL